MESLERNENKSYYYRPTADELKTIPASLRESPFWLCWQERPPRKPGAKPAKVPVDPASLRNINPLDPANPMTFEAALLAYERNPELAGIGFVFAPENAFAGVDIDKCRNPDTGQIEPWAWELTRLADSYTEVSPSGTGIKIFLKADLAGRASNFEYAGREIEAYSARRYFTVTGLHVEGTSWAVNDRQQTVESLLQKEPEWTAIGKLDRSQDAAAPLVDAMSDEELRAKIVQSKQGVKFQRLMAGDTTGYAGYFSASGALCAILASWTRSNPERVDRIARTSDLIVGWEQWWEESGRGERTVAKACALAAAGWLYDPRPPTDQTAAKGSWRTKFHTVDELATGAIPMYIASFLPEGVTALGSLSGVGKTWLALSMARALTTGDPFLGVFAVPEKVNVIYLVPEMGERALRMRAEKMGIPTNGSFYCQTLSDGAINLQDRDLLEALKELRPIVFFDTVVRFAAILDENASRQNASGLAEGLFMLRRAGAKACVCLHHSPKAASDAEFMTLENVLRGTGDLGAMCDAVWGLAHDKRKLKKGFDDDYTDESIELTRLSAKCVKPRDFDPAPPFRIQGRPYIDNKGDFVVISEASGPELEAQIVAAIEENPRVSLRELQSRFRSRFQRIKDVAGAARWKQAKNGLWLKA